MKKWFVIVGAVFLVLAALGVAWFVKDVKQGMALDRESKAYVDSAIPAIVSSWNAQELLDRASPELMAATRPEDVGKLFELFRPLGRLSKYQGSQGQAIIYTDLAKGTTVSRSYIAKAAF